MKTPIPFSGPAQQLDFYKTDHKSQYPAGTELVYSNFTARSSQHAPVLLNHYDDTVVFLGLQVFILDYLVRDWDDNFFKRDKDSVIGPYKRRMDNSLGPDSVSTRELEELHDLGCLPLAIYALPEGSHVNIGVPFFVMFNTASKFFWLTNYLETVASSEIWKPCTTATIAANYRALLEKWAEHTGTDPSFVDVQAHDFSFRGMSGRWDASISGLGHLSSFIGTDTIPAIDAAEHFYNAGADGSPVGVSVSATEHSVMCMGGKEDELTTFKRLITETYPTGIVSIVSDTWDFWKVISETVPALKSEILSREKDAMGFAKVVIRPDSGDPADILCGLRIPDLTYTGNMDHATRTLFGTGYRPIPEELDSEVRIFSFGDKYYEVEGHRALGGKPVLMDPVEVQLTPEQKGAVECLWETFGGTLTYTGHKLLDEHIGLIYGDSITPERAEDILYRLACKGFASGNVVLGVGSFTYQHITRDTFGMAMKATYGVVNGQPREIFKDPKTGDGTKKSATGLLEVVGESGNYKLLDRRSSSEYRDALKLHPPKLGAFNRVFLNGEVSNLCQWKDVKARALRIPLQET